MNATATQNKPRILPDVSKANAAPVASAASANESKADAFKRLASARVSKALHAIALLEPLANKSQYEYDAEQVAKICEAIQNQLDNVKRTFATGKATRAGFSL